MQPPGTWCWTEVDNSIHKQAAIMQLVGFPCSINYKVKWEFVLAAVIRSLHESIKRRQTLNGLRDGARLRQNTKLDLNQHHHSRKEDAALLSKWKVDVRLYDVNADVDISFERLRCSILCKHQTY